MKDRIQQIIDYKGISAGDLAELLEVQRSNISHILNGRNKPGAVFIEKLLQAFPEIDARWLLTGEGDMLLFKALKESPGSIKHPINDTATKSVFSPAGIPVQSAGAPGKNKIIEKIVLLYSDGTFTYYNNK